MNHNSLQNEIYSLIKTTLRKQHSLDSSYSGGGLVVLGCQDPGLTFNKKKYIRGDKVVPVPVSEKTSNTNAAIDISDYTSLSSDPIPCTLFIINMTLLLTDIHLYAT